MSDGHQGDVVLGNIVVPSGGATGASGDNGPSGATGVTGSIGAPDANSSAGAASPELGDLNKLIKLVAGVQAKIAGISNDFQENRKYLEGKINNFNEEIQKNRISLIEALSIFVALFTFVSINIQVFTRVSSTVSAGIIVFLLLMCLITWSFITSLILRPPKNNTGQDTYEYNYIRKDVRIWLAVGSCGLALISIIVFNIFNIPLNPVSDNIEFQKEIQKIVDEKLNLILTNENNLKIMNDKKLSDFKRCLWENGYTWYCLNDLEK